MNASYFDTLSSKITQAAAVLATAPSDQKNRALKSIATAIDAKRTDIKKANAQDYEDSKRQIMDAAMLERLLLNDQRIDAMIEGLHQIAALADPVGEISNLRPRPSGIQVGHMRVPLGVIGVIYESRPNVTIDAAALCLKSGNGCILRGGSESIHSNLALSECIRQGLIEAELPVDCVHVVNNPDRAIVSDMLRATHLIDVIIPRGGKSLIERVISESKVPVIKHLDGVCHVYVDEHATLEQALAIAVNAKTQRYGVCNAMETLLVHEAVAPSFLPSFATTILGVDASMQLRGCHLTKAILPTCQLAQEEDWTTEYLAPILAIRVVSSIDEAISHINTYGSHHTDSIVTEHWSRAQRFLREVDSSSVMVNASTRFADGFEYGLGGEIGISTNKLHARGPVGLEGLTTLKYIVLGSGQIRG